MHDPRLVDRITAFSGNEPGSGALMTFTDSAWLMSVVLPHQPHFDGQPSGVTTLWGYGLFLDKRGDFVDRTLAEATGSEIITELLGHLGFGDILDEVQATTTVVPVMMPYITSEFERRTADDRPRVLPVGAENFAFLGQYTEIPHGVVFTVDYSVRSAMIAVYGLLGLDQEIPDFSHGALDFGTLFARSRPPSPDLDLTISRTSPKRDSARSSARCRWCRTAGIARCSPTTCARSWAIPSR